MIAMKVDKRFFFDRKAVEDIVGKRAAQALSKAGAFVQRRARSSLRRRKKTSAPGQTPSVHSKDKVATLKNIQFQFSPRTQSVLVGPLRLNMVTQDAYSTALIPVPGIHEHGGTVLLREWRFNQLDFEKSWRGWRKYRSTNNFSNEWRRADKRWRYASRKRRKHTIGELGVETRTRKVSYPERPFMGPALDKEAPKFPSLFGRSA